MDSHESRQVGLYQGAIDWKWSSARCYLGPPERQQDADLPHIDGLPAGRDEARMPRSKSLESCAQTGIADRARWHTSPNQLPANFAGVTPAACLPPRAGRLAPCRYKPKRRGVSSVAGQHCSKASSCQFDDLRVVDLFAAVHSERGFKLVSVEAGGDQLHHHFTIQSLNLSVFASARSGSMA